MKYTILLGLLFVSLLKTPIFSHSKKDILIDINNLTRTELRDDDYHLNFNIYYLDDKTINRFELDFFKKYIINGIIKKNKSNFVLYFEMFTNSKIINNKIIKYNVENNLSKYIFYNQNKDKLNPIDFKIIESWNGTDIYSYKFILVFKENKNNIYFKIDDKFNEEHNIDLSKFIKLNIKP